MPSQDNNKSTDLDEPESPTVGPGQRPMKPGSIVAVAGYLVVVSVLVLYGLIKLWPYPTPSGENPKSENQDVASSVPCPAPPQPQAGSTPTQSSNSPSPGASGSVPEQNRSTTGSSQPAGSQTTNGAGVGSTSNANQSARPTNSNQPANSTSGRPVSPSNQPATTSAAATNDAEAAANTRPGSPTSTETASKSTPQPTASGTAQKKLPDPDCISFFGTSPVPVYLETRLLLLVMLSGALGSLMHSLRSLYWYTGNRLMVWSWVAFYLLLPLTGAILAVIFYFVVRGGFFSPQASFENTSPFGFAALSALVGLFSPQATLKLKEIAETIFSKPGAGTDNKPQESASQAPSPKPIPTIASIAPSSDADTKDVAITGSGFAQGATVKFGQVSGVVNSVSDTRIAVSVPDSTAAGPVDVEVTVGDQKAKLANGFTYTAGGKASGPEIDELDGHDEIKSNTTDEDLPITEGGVG